MIKQSKYYSEEQTLMFVLKLLADNALKEHKCNHDKVMQLIDLRCDKEMFDKKYVAQYLEFILK